MLDTFYPGEAALTALLLAVAPYLLLRGPIARIASITGATPPAVGLSPALAHTDAAAQAVDLATDRPDNQASAQTGARAQD